MTFYDKIKYRFPEKWYVVADDTNYIELDKIRRKLFIPIGSCYKRFYSPDTTYIMPTYSLVSKHLTDESNYYSDNVSLREEYSGYTQLTFEELLKLIESEPSSQYLENYYQL